MEDGTAPRGAVINDGDANRMAMTFGEGMCRCKAGRETLGDKHRKDGEEDWPQPPSPFHAVGSHHALGPEIPRHGIGIRRVSQFGPIEAMHCLGTAPTYRRCRRHSVQRRRYHPIPSGGCSQSKKAAIRPTPIASFTSVARADIMYANTSRGSWSYRKASASKGMNSGVFASGPLDCRPTRRNRYWNLSGTLARFRGVGTKDGFS